jgi:N6-adenosine-specific RNA methylase IME4
MQLRVLPTAEMDLHVGLGLTTRKNEFCLLGRRGNCKRQSKKVREVILAPVREHSRKPDEAYRRIMEYADGPYVELFARLIIWWLA